MATVVLFPSVLGLRPGVTETAARLRAAGHTAEVVDLLEGRTFDAYEPALAHARERDEEADRAAALARVDALDGPVHFVGFSSGGALAEHAAALRPEAAAGVVVVGSALPLQYVAEGHPWPAGVPAQEHICRSDPFDDGDEVRAQFRADVAAAGGSVEFFTYPGSGHLFNDPSLPAEFDPAAAERFYQRLLDFVGR